jgi:glycosyltransferase involved in cell wall biosynthesis
MSNIAFEISPLLTASGTYGDKSGVYRYMIGLINAIGSLNSIKKENIKIILFTFNHKLLLNQLNPDFIELLKNNESFIFLNKFLPNNQPITKKWFFFKFLRNKFLIFKIFFKFINKLINIEKYYQFIKEKSDLYNYIFYLNQEFKKNNVKIIFHSETGFKKIIGYKNIITIYDLTTILFPDSHRPETIDLHNRKLIFTHNYCDEIICISQSTKSDLLSYFPTFKKKKIIVAYPGSSFKSKDNIRSSLIQIINSISNKKVSIKTKKYLLYFGTFEPRKNLFYLTKAFLDLLESKKIPSDYKLVMIGGDGWGNTKLQIINYLKESYLDQEKIPVIISNYINDKNLIKIIKGAYAVVYPSLYEGFGLPVLESMSLGIPVICSKNSSLTEVGGDSVLYVNPKDFFDIKNKIEYLINNPKLIKILSKKGLLQSKKFSWEKTAKKIYNFFKFDL